MPIPSLFTGAGALTTQQNAINVISNNIANVNTTAFKSSRIYFVEETSNMSRPASSPTGTIAGTNPFEIGTGLSINQATGTLVGRTFSKSLFSLVTPFSLALQI